VLEGPILGLGAGVFRLRIFALGCLSRIERILIFLGGFLAVIERRVSLQACFWDATSDVGVDCACFAGRPRFFGELLIEVAWSLAIVRACATRINEDMSLWLERCEG
jgi:hypothetical protein